MNARKTADYSAMFAVLDKLVAAGLPQMELYCEIGRLVSGRPEKGAAVAAAEYLNTEYPDATGFSPRNLRRMRDFYRTYADTPEVMEEAMAVGWTQNVVILEAELTIQERTWYIGAVRRFGWSKQELQRQITSDERKENTLDFGDELCYTEDKSNSKEDPDAGIESDRAGTNRIHRNQHQGKRQFVLFPGEAQASQARNQACRQDDTSTYLSRLLRTRFADWIGSSQTAQRNQYLQGDLMINFCDYDAIKHYQSGKFNAKYKTDLTGKLQPADRVSYGTQITDSFKDGRYQTFLTKEPIILYRVFGQYWSVEQAGPRGAKLNGGFASTEFAESIIDAKLRLALDPAWANTKMYEERLVVPADTTLSIGIVASVVLKTGTILPGGADQILLPQGWSESWITGYRRLTSRQLQSAPYFSAQKPPEYNNKKRLYSLICPACGCEECRKLADEEQFTITGSKGNPYTMRYTCMNPDCQYYW